MIFLRYVDELLFFTAKFLDRLLFWAGSEPEKTAENPKNK